MLCRVAGLELATEVGRSCHGVVAVGVMGGQVLGPLGVVGSGALWALKKLFILDE